jgi:hypothetical protein
MPAPLSGALRAQRAVAPHNKPKVEATNHPTATTLSPERSEPKTMTPSATR